MSGGTKDSSKIDIPVQGDSPPLPTSFGRYKVVALLSEGYMGIVYLAKDHRIHRDVAIKVLKLDPSLSKAQETNRAERFKREAQVAGRLAHPNIVTVYDVDEDRGTPLIVMEYLKGITLSDVVASGPVPIPDALEIITRVLSAMEYLHKHDVIHRDIKPDNVFLLEDGNVKVADFGIAHLTTTGTMTMAGTFVGPPRYMSPEQVEGKDVGVASDIFSVGALLYELLTGEKAFDSSTPTSTMEKVVYEEPRPPQRINPAITHNLEGIILRSLSKLPHHRYPSASEMKREILKESAQGEPGALQLLGRAIATQRAREQTTRERKTPVQAPGAMSETILVPPISEPPQQVDTDVTPEKDQVARTAPPVPGTLIVTPLQEIMPEEEPAAMAEEETAEDEVYEAPAASSGGPEQYRPRKRILISAVGLLVILVVSITVVFAVNSRKGVPGVLGLSEVDAKQKVESAGYKFASEYKVDDKAETGKVIELRPKENEHAKKGSVITAVISSKGQVDVPNLVGTQQDQALATLKGQSLNYKLTQQGTDDQAQHGIIISQDPGAGAKLDAGSEVALIVAVYQPSQAQTPPATPTPEKKTRKVACPTCGGAGVITTTYNETISAACSNCGGSGWTKDAAGMPVRCPVCGGSGSVQQTVQRQRQTTCPTCGGTGFLIEEFWQ